MDWGLYTTFRWWTDELAEDSHEIGYCMGVACYALVV